MKGSQKLKSEGNSKFDLLSSVRTTKESDSFTHNSKISGFNSFRNGSGVTDQQYQQSYPFKEFEFHAVLTPQSHSPLSTVLSTAVKAPVKTDLFFSQNQKTYDFSDIRSSEKDKNFSTYFSGQQDSLQKTPRNSPGANLVIPLDLSKLNVGKTSQSPNTLLTKAGISGFMSDRLNNRIPDIAFEKKEARLPHIVAEVKSVKKTIEISPICHGKQEEIGLLLQSQYRAVSYSDELFMESSISPKRKETWMASEPSLKGDFDYKFTEQLTPREKLEKTEMNDFIDDSPINQFLTNQNMKQNQFNTPRSFGEKVDEFSVNNQRFSQQAGFDESSEKTQKGQSSNFEKQILTGRIEPIFEIRKNLPDYYPLSTQSKISPRYTPTVKSTNQNFQFSEGIRETTQEHHSENFSINSISTNVPSPDLELIKPKHKIEPFILKGGKVNSNPYISDMINSNQFDDQRCMTAESLQNKDNFTPSFNSDTEYDGSYVIKKPISQYLKQQITISTPKNPQTNLNYLQQKEIILTNVKQNFLQDIKNDERNYTPTPNFSPQYNTNTNFQTINQFSPNSIGKIHDPKKIFFIPKLNLGQLGTNFTATQNSENQFKISTGSEQIQEGQLKEQNAKPTVILTERPTQKKHELSFNSPATIDLYSQVNNQMNRFREQNQTERLLSQISNSQEKFLFSPTKFQY